MPIVKHQTSKPEPETLDRKYDKSFDNIHMQVIIYGLFCYATIIVLNIGKTSTLF